MLGDLRALLDEQADRGDLDGAVELLALIDRARRGPEALLPLGDDQPPPVRDYQAAYDEAAGRFREAGRRAQALLLAEGQVGPARLVANESLQPPSLPRPGTIGPVGYATDRLRETYPSRRGWRGAPFREQAPTGGYLAGLRVTRYDKFGRSIRTVQPIFRAGAGLVDGQVHGDPGEDPSVLLARPGHAVGAIETRAGLVFNALRITFMRVVDGRLDPGDSYTSDWVGSDGGFPGRHSGDGDLIVGVVGSVDQGAISGFGLLAAEGAPDDPGQRP